MAVEPLVSLRKARKRFKAVPESCVRIGNGERAPEDLVSTTMAAQRGANALLGELRSEAHGRQRADMYRSHIDLTTHLDYE